MTHGAKVDMYAVTSAQLFTRGYTKCYNISKLLYVWIAYRQNRSKMIVDSSSPKAVGIVDQISSIPKSISTFSPGLNMGSPAAPVYFSAMPGYAF